MGHWVIVGQGGILAVDRVVAVARANSAPIRRLVEAVGRERMVDLTFGHPRRAVVVLDSGHVVAVSLTPEALLRKLQEQCQKNIPQNRALQYVPYFPDVDPKEKENKQSNANKAQ